MTVLMSRSWRLRVLNSNESLAALDCTLVLNENEVSQYRKKWKAEACRDKEMTMLERLLSYQHVTVLSAVRSYPIHILTTSIQISNIKTPWKNLLQTRSELDSNSLVPLFCHLWSGLPMIFPNALLPQHFSFCSQRCSIPPSFTIPVNKFGDARPKA